MRTKKSYTSLSGGACIDVMRADPFPHRLTLQLFGAFAMCIDGEPLSRLRSVKTLWLLALLAFRHGREVTRDWLAGALWPESSDRQAKDYLRHSLTDLRRVLGSHAYRLNSPTYKTLLLELSGADVDMIDFDRAAAAPDRASLERAVALYRGPLLDGCTEEWVYQERQSREQAYLHALETLAADTLSQNDAVTAAGYLRRVVTVDPFREGAQRSLMQALAASGNYSAVVQVYRELRLLLHQELHTEPDPRTTALFQQIRTRARSLAQWPGTVPAALRRPAPSSQVISNNLPIRISSFVGREKQMAEIRTLLLDKTRLLTLTGSGGSGKTRLSLQVAADILQAFPDGVRLVELATLTDPALVPRAMAQALGLMEEAGRAITQTLTDHLKTRKALLLLDNCEHLLDACARLADLLMRSCPGVHILASSREGLGIEGELTYRVPSLSLPDPRQPQTPQSLCSYEAVRLFIERAQFHQPSFVVTHQNAPALAWVCYRLDGIPLAIELAAARVPSLSVEEINIRLNQRFRLLTGGSRTALPRHQTLRALIDWSYDLLNVKEKTLLCRLSIFAGGWTLEAAEVVCSGEGIFHGELLDLLTSLVNKSLVVFEEHAGGRARYHLQETMRQYGAERLEEAGGTEVLHNRHRDFFLQWAEGSRHHQKGASQAHWLSVLEEEHDNLRAALTYCLSNPQGGEKGLRFGASLHWFWHVRGYLSEGRAQLRALLSHPGAQVRTRARAATLFGAGAMAWFQADYASARSVYDEGLAIYRELGDRQGIAHALSSLGNVAGYQGDYASARALLQESLAIRQELGDRQGIAHTLSNLASVVEAWGDHPSARVLFQESLAIYRELGDRQGIAHTLGNLGMAIQEEGDHALARSLYDQSLAMHREMGHRAGVAGVLKNIGTLASSQSDYATARSLYDESLTILWELGDRYGIAGLLELFASLTLKEARAEHATRLWGAASALRKGIGSPLPPVEREKQKPELISAKEAMTEDAFTAAWEEGQTMTLEQAIQFARAANY